MIRSVRELLTESATPARPIFAFAIATIVAFAPVSLTHAQGAASDDPSWMWSESQWREAVERVRAGRRMLPETWPDGGRVAVTLSFDMDSETLLLRDSNTSPSRLSVGQYGPRAGTPRILDMLERYDIPSTWFIPAVSAQLYPDEVRAVAAAGHEIGIHGWIHEHTSQLDREDERMLMQRSLEAIEELSGRRPVGIRTGSWEYSHNTAELIAEAGLLYDSSLMADDVPYELMANGEATGVVELPVEWILDDYPYFAMNRAADIRPYTPPSGVFEIWKREFDMAYDEGGMFLLTMHPQIIGHRSRVSMLEELIQYMRSKPGVWFATHEDVARAARDHEGD